MRDSACRWFIVENAKTFPSYVTHFLIFPRERNCRILIGLSREVFMNYPIMFLDRDNKGKLLFRTLMRKINFNKKSLCIINKLIKLFYLLFSCERVAEKSN